MPVLRRIVMKKILMLFAAAALIIITSVLLVSCAKVQPINEFTGKGPGLAVSGPEDVFYGFDYTAEKDSNGNLTSVSLSTSSYVFDYIEGKEDDTVSLSVSGIDLPATETIRFEYTYGSDGTLTVCDLLSGHFDGMKVGSLRYLYDGGRITGLDFYSFVVKDENGNYINAYMQLLMNTGRFVFIGNTDLFKACKNAVGADKELSLLAHQDITYGSDGEITKIESKDPDGKIQSTRYVKNNKYYTDFYDGSSTVQTYHENGLLGSKTDYLAGNKMYSHVSYNDKGMMLLTQSYGEYQGKMILDSMIEFKYDSDGYVKSITAKSERNQIGSFWDYLLGHSVSSTVEFDYSGDGLTVYKKTNDSGRTAVRKVKYETVKDDAYFDSDAVLFTVTQLDHPAVVSFAVPYTGSVDLRQYNFDSFDIVPVDYNPVYGSSASFVSTSSLSPEALGSIVSSEAVYQVIEQADVKTTTIKIAQPEYGYRLYRLNNPACASVIGDALGFNYFYYDELCYASKEYSGDAKLIPLNGASLRFSWKSTDHSGDSGSKYVEATVSSPLLPDDKAQKITYSRQYGWTITSFSYGDYDPETGSFTEEISGTEGKYALPGSDDFVTYDSSDFHESFEYYTNSFNAELKNNNAGRLLPYRINLKYLNTLNTLNILNDRARVFLEVDGVSENYYFDNAPSYIFEPKDGRADEDDLISASGYLVVRMSSDLKPLEVVFLSKVYNEDGQGYENADQCVRGEGVYYYPGTDYVVLDDSTLDEIVSAAKLITNNVSAIGHYPPFD